MHSVPVPVNVRCYSNSDIICSAQRSDAKGHKETSIKGFHSATINLSEFRPEIPVRYLGGLSSMQPETRYAKSGDVHIAYQVFGEGSLNLVFIPPFFSNVEVWWDQPDYTRALTRLGNYAKVLIFDKRGTGMSDRVAELPGMEQRMDDLRAVMDAAGMDQAALLGVSEGGSMATLFAATYPSRCRALVLIGAYARFSSFVETEEELAEFFKYTEQSWGSGLSAHKFAPSRANDPVFQRWWGRHERTGASPAAAAALMRMNEQIDISDVVSTIRVPTLVIHRTGDKAVNVEGGVF
jgi:pimeloyl-ACP methyl ester carboxylesterase